MSTISDYYYNQIFDYILAKRGEIEVSSDFHCQMKEINCLLNNDYTGLVSTILDFMVHSANVNIDFNTDNSNLNRLFQIWKKELNSGISIDVPSGLRSFSEQYFRERWKSSFIVLNIKWNQINGYWLPSRMWFTEGASIYVERDHDSLNCTRYFVGRPCRKMTNLLPLPKSDVIVRKPYNSWYDKYPVPYLVKRGALYHALFKKAVLQKQATVAESIMPLLAQLKMGSVEAMKQGMMPTETDLCQMKEEWQDIREKYEEYTKSKGLVGAFPFDVNFEQQIPDLSKILNADLTKATDKDLLASLGLIELKGFSSDREEAILNPKVLVEEVKDAVLDYTELLYAVMALVKEKNASFHRKSVKFDIRIIPGTIKAFITNDLKVLARSWYDRGLLSKRYALEDTLGLNFETQVSTRKQEDRDGVDDIMYPPVIMNQEQHEDDVETPEQIKEESPEKKKTEKDVEASMEETEIITEPMKTVRSIPKEIKGALTKKQQQLFKKIFNITFSDYNHMDSALREHIALTTAWEAVKEIVEAPYTETNYPSQIEELPKAAKKIWIDTFNTVLEETEDENKARQAAWRNVKLQYEKNDDGDWVKIKAQKTYNDYPKAASENAKRALKYRDETGNPRNCGTRVGWERANQLANRESLSRDTIARMASFKRHEQHKDVPYDEGCGGLMWDAWGGDEGIDWAIRKLEEIDKE